MLARRKSHPASAPSITPASGARGTSVVTLTRMPSTTPINAPTPTKNHVPRTSSLIPIPIILAFPETRGQGHTKPRRAARKIGLAGIEDEPSGLCDSADLLPSLSGAVLRPSAPRERVPSRRARHRSDAELRAGHRRKTPADRLHLGSIFSSRGGRRREARCLAASDVRLHPPLARSKLARLSRSASTHPARATMRP